MTNTTEAIVELDTDTTEAIVELDTDTIEANQARVAVMMTLLPEQLRLVADWLIAEASIDTHTDDGPHDLYDLASKHLVQELLEHADFKEGHISTYSSREKQIFSVDESRMS
ncbi:MAG: hypothetical protein AAFP20_20350 [Cyanobacteria bacterium J06614_10]